MNNMSFINRFFGHLKNITIHRHLVMSMCFKCGMYKQGLLHDLSKYSFNEFWPSVKYYQGNRSPITYEKEVKGISYCWLHHKGRNKHHWEYYTDRVKYDLINHQMPFNYVLESVLDKIAASKVYKKENYNTNYPYDFFMSSYEIKVMNQETARQVSMLLKYLKDNNENKTLNYIKSLYKNYKKDNKFTI